MAQIRTFAKVNFENVLPEEKMAFIDKHWGWRFKIQASMTNGRSEKYAEIFEYSPYGRKASQEEFQALFDL